MSKKCLINHLKIRWQCLKIWNFSVETFLFEKKKCDENICRFCREWTKRNVLCLFGTLDVSKCFYRCTYEYDLFKWNELSGRIKLKRTTVVWYFNRNEVKLAAFAGRTYIIWHSVRNERFNSFRSIATLSEFTIHWHRTLPIRSAVHHVLFSFAYTLSLCIGSFRANFVICVIESTQKIPLFANLTRRKSHLIESDWML